MLQLKLNQHLADGQFSAMASPCQLLIDTDDIRLAANLLDLVAKEAWRIEQQYSRYRQDNIIYQINTALGKPTPVDDETARLLDFAAQLYQLSDCMFDITSGVLRQVWQFDGSDRVPTQAQINAILPTVGWARVTWQSPVLTMPVGMQIDFGGIGKEYAVDQAYTLVEQHFDGAFLINFGGDLRAKGTRQDGQAWQVGVEQPTAVTAHPVAATTLPLITGAIATSGDSRRFLLKDGVRYSHLLNPLTGWSVPDCPRSVTVQAATCTQAGMLASFAQLAGRGAQDFLAAQQDIHYWIID